MAKIIFLNRKSKEIITLKPLLNQDKQNYYFKQEI